MAVSDTWAGLIDAVELSTVVGLAVVTQDVAKDSMPYQRWYCRPRVDQKESLVTSTACETCMPARGMSCSWEAVLFPEMTATLSTSLGNGCC